MLGSNGEGGGEDRSGIRRVDSAGEVDQTLAQER
jgi:hypothetical protein